MVDDRKTEALELLQKKLRGKGTGTYIKQTKKRVHLHREKALMTEKQKDCLKKLTEQDMTEQEKKAFDALADASKQVTDRAKELSDVLGFSPDYRDDAKAKQITGQPEGMLLPEDYPLPLTEDGQKQIREQLRKSRDRYAHDNTIPDPSIGIKYDDGKTRFDLLIAEFVKEVADVFTKGLDKYPAWNYIKLHKDRIASAHLRHFNAYQRGEIIDPETGLSHLAHATCCLQMLWAIDNEFFGKDERLEQLK